MWAYRNLALLPCLRVYYRHKQVVVVVVVVRRAIHVLNPLELTRWIYIFAELPDRPQDRYACRQVLTHSATYLANLAACHKLQWLQAQASCIFVGRSRVQITCISIHTHIHMCVCVCVGIYSCLTILVNRYMSTTISPAAS